ncbi:MAG: hypothetical protein HYV95_02010 [Opitutae bacterium]|nr:hypothetical protein [Opitutae bacterium]
MPPTHTDVVIGVTTREILLAVGVSFCLLGVVLRGFHQSNLRTAALRAQTARFSRAAGKAEPTGPHEPPSLLVRRLPLIYRLAVGLGALLALLGYWLG